MANCYVINLFKGGPEPGASGIGSQSKKVHADEANCDGGTVVTADRNAIAISVVHITCVEAAAFHFFVGEHKGMLL